VALWAAVGMTMAAAPAVASTSGNILQLHIQISRSPQQVSTSHRKTCNVN
jgi:hypothetical protein